MIIEPEQLSPTIDGERTLLKSSPAASSAQNYNTNIPPPPPYTPPDSSTVGYSGSAQSPTTIHRDDHVSANPNPQPFKRFAKAFLVAILCITLWGIFLDTLNLFIEVDIGVPPDERLQELTPVERYMNMGPGGRIRKLYFSLITESWTPSSPVLPAPDSIHRSHMPTPTSTLLLNPSSAPDLAYPRPLPIQYPPSLSWVSPPARPSETL